MIQGALFHAEEWKDSVYARLVRQVGDLMYWDDWAQDIQMIAERHITLINAHLADADRTGFDAFVEALRGTVNPEVSAGEAVEMLAQHLITRPIFEAMFPDRAFGEVSPVSRALDGVLASLDENAAFAREREPLEKFYTKVTESIRGLPDVASKQAMLLTLYDKFFSKAFPKLADRMGIVFTPVPVVDYILRSTDELVRAQFAKGLGDPGVTVLEPFAGTGTFITRLLQLGLIGAGDLNRTYAQELFANEIVPLSCYIASINIESVYRGVCSDLGVEPLDGGFPGMTLTDTFAMNERASQLSGNVFPTNTERMERQMEADVRVIVMNPPYSVGQGSANDNNQNTKYHLVDGRIELTYVARSTAQNKNGLYDSYFRRCAGRRTGSGRRV